MYVINVINVQYNGGFLPDIITLGNPFDTMNSFCPYSQRSHLDCLTFPPLVLIY